MPVVRPVRLGDRLGIDDIVRPHRNEILRLARAYGAKRVRIFGSVRRREAGAKSDVDLLVDRLPRASLLDRAHLEVELGKILGREVDVIEEGDLDWSIRPQVLAEAVPV